MIAKVNAIRTQAIKVADSWVTLKIETPYTNDHTIVNRKGEDISQIIGVYSNLGENGEYYNLTLDSTITGFHDDEKVMEIMTCTLLTTASNGAVVVPMGAGQPKILFPYAALNGSTFCSDYTTTPTTGTDCEPARITFEILVTTAYGESVVVTGDIPALGNWDIPDGLFLSASDYTTNNPLWQGTATGTDPQEVFAWKPVVIQLNGSYEYSPGANLQATAPGPACTPTATLTYTFAGS